MENNSHPTTGNGKICYLEIPAVDIKKPMSFYKAVFGWHIRQRSDGHIAFDDGVGEVSGTWVTDRTPLATIGILIYIMVDDINAAIDLVIANGGVIVQP